MKTICITVLIIAAALGAAAFLLGCTTLRVPAGARPGKLRVACVGDSLSYGCTIPLFWLRRYPAVLGRLLGPDYQVGVFAVNDRTLQDTGNKPFRRERAFRQSLAFRPDAVVLLLGTNDTKDRNWVSDEAFRAQYAELIAAYRALPSSPRVLVCAPPMAFPPPFPPLGLPEATARGRIPEIVALSAALARDEGLEWVDLYALTKDRRELFGLDGLHFNAKGARTAAKAVYSLLKEQPSGKVR